MKPISFFDQYKILHVHREVESPPPVAEKVHDGYEYDPCTNSYFDYKNNCKISKYDYSEILRDNKFRFPSRYKRAKKTKIKYNMDIQCVPGLLSCLKIKQKLKLKPYVFSVSKDEDYWHYSEKDGENYSKILNQGTPSNYRKFNELLIKEKSIPTKKTE